MQCSVRDVGRSINARISADCPAGDENGSTALLAMTIGPASMVLAYGLRVDSTCVDFERPELTLGTASKDDHKCI